MKKFLKVVLKLLLFTLVLALFWAIWNRDLVSYGWMQLKGQVGIVWNARPVTEVLNDPLVTEATKKRLQYIEVVRQFAIDSLGLKDSKNYTTFYEQKDKSLLWVLTASEPYRLKSYHWKFPVVGEVSYKGFFEKEKGKKEDLLLIQKGYDTDYSSVSAWSTLGWFRDPILSAILKRSDGQLADLLIHEMTHATLYVKSDVNFNENFASAIGEAGAIKFLNFYYGPDSPQMKEYFDRKADNDLYNNHMLLACKKLDTLYLRIEHLDDSLKAKFKNDFMEQIATSLDTLSFRSPDRYKSIFSKRLPNNAYLMNFVRYDAQKSAMREELRTKYYDNISQYIEAIRLKYN